MEVGGDHIILVPYADDIGIGIVGGQDRVAVMAVTEISPGVSVGDGPAAGDKERETCNQGKYFHSGRGFPSLICW